MGFSKHHVVMVSALALVAACCAPTLASAQSGCAELDGAAQRADCTARAHAREAARAEVQRRLDGGRADADGSAVQRPAAWDAAIEEASGVHLDELVAPRPFALLVGLAWLALLARARARDLRGRLRAARRPTIA